MVGVFVPEDPHSPNKLGKKGKIAFDIGQFWFKGPREMAADQANVKAYNRQLRDLIHAEKAQPAFLVSHDPGLNEAPMAYEHFDARDDGRTKVVLKPTQ